MFRVLNGIRLFAIMLGAGAALIHSGWNELVLREGTSSVPVEVSMEQLEAGELPSGSYWRIGHHVAMANVGVYKYSRPKSEKGDPTAKTTVDVYYYPIISTRHPFLAPVAEVRNVSVPADRTSTTTVPPFEDFAVLVKTRRFATFGALPTRATEEAQIQGMAINRVAKLDERERKELATLFPRIDPNKLVIFEEGRSPSTAVGPYLSIVLGSAVCLVWPVWIFIASRRGRGLSANA